MNLTAYLYLLPRLRMCRAIPALPPYVFIVWYLIKHRGNFQTFFAGCKMRRSDLHVRVFDVQNY
jgi:hypothetical protein